MFDYFRELSLHHCEQGEGLACSVTLSWLEVDDDPPPGKSEADMERLKAQALETACREGVVTACPDFGQSLYQGRGRPRDALYALEVFKLNCANGVGDCLR